MFSSCPSIRSTIDFSVFTSFLIISILKSWIKWIFFFVLYYSRNSCFVMARVAIFRCIYYGLLLRAEQFDSVDRFEAKINRINCESIVGILLIKRTRIFIFNSRVQSTLVKFDQNRLYFVVNLWKLLVLDMKCELRIQY